jgi:hypothetical protein
MSKYTDELVKGHNTLLNKVLELESIIDNLREDKKNLTLDNIKLKQENNNLRNNFCEKRRNCMIMKTKIADYMMGGF